MENRLKAAYEQIDRGSVELLSLDVFDTVLWRKVPVPEDVFLMLGYRLKREGWLIPAMPAEAFVEFRVKAEKIARAKKEEVTLQEIYWALSGIFNKITVEEMVEGKKGILGESDVDDPVALELELEKQLFCFDENIVQLVKYAHGKNIPVVLISNTYFTESNVREFLQPEFLSLVKQLFISCEYGVSKGNGLFAQMIEETTFAPQKILHIGDNYKADFLTAQKLGIHALYYQKYGDEFAKVVNLEWPVKDPFERNLLLDECEGDFGLTSLRAKILNENSDFFWQYGASVLGPCLTAFTHFVYDRCREMKERQVFCLMREGRLYNKLIQEYAPYYPNHKLHTQELWASRQFITHACIAYGSPLEIFAATKSHPISRFTFETFTAYLGLDIQKIKKWLKYRYVKLDDPDLCMELATYLSENEALREEIIKTAAAKRKRFMNYLSSLTDLTKLSQLTLVDVGWSGTIQGALQAILYLSGYKIQVHGLYLATSHDTDTAMMQGFIREGYLTKANYPQGDVRVIRRGMYPMEQTAIAGLGPMVDIDENRNIITAKPSMTKLQERESLIVQEGIMAFCHTLGKFLQNNPWNSRSENLIRQLRHIWLRSAGCPTKEEANAFKQWAHDHVSHKGASTHVLGKNKYYEKFIKDMLPKFAYEDWGMTWPAAYAAKHGEVLTKTAFAGHIETTPPACFLSIDDLPLKIFIDHGKGFPKKAAEHLSLKSNANRKFYAFHKLFSITQPIKQIRLEIEAPNSLVKIESLRLTTHRTDDPGSKMATFFESEEEKNIHCSYPQEKPGVFACKEAPLALTCTFEDPHVYLLYINLCLSTFSI